MMEPVSPDLQVSALRACLQAGGIGIVWCGLGMSHGLATQAARREGVGLLAALGMQDLHINRSACEGLAVVALSACQPVGVDVERGRSTSVNLAPSLGVWVRKEAVLKALGVGLAVAPDDVDTGDEDAQWRSVPVGVHGVVHLRSLQTPVADACGALAAQHPGPVLQTVATGSASR